MSLTNQLGTVQEAADLLKVSTKTIRRYITAGTIRAQRVGPKMIRVDLDSLNELGRPLQYIEGGDHE